MSQRKLQRESVLLRAVQEVISRGLADPRIRGLVTVTGIKLSEDGKLATVSISVLPDDRQDLTMHGLKAATKKIRKDAMAKVRLKDMPVLEFVTDPTIKQQGELLAAINKAAAATPPSDLPPTTEPTTDPGGASHDARSGERPPA